MDEVKLERHLDDMRSHSHLVRDLILDVSDDFDDNKEQLIHHLLFHIPFIRSLTVIHMLEIMPHLNKSSPYFSTWKQSPYRKDIMTQPFPASLTQISMFPKPFLLELHQSVHFC